MNDDELDGLTIAVAEEASQTSVSPAPVAEVPEPRTSDSDRSEATDVIDSYDPEVAKQVLRESDGDLNLAANLLRQRGFDDSTILEIGRRAAEDPQVTNDETVGPLLQRGLTTLAQQNAAPTEQQPPLSDLSETTLESVASIEAAIDEFGNPVAPPPGGFIDESGNPMPPMAYDRELARQVLRESGGDLEKAAQALLGRGFDLDRVMAFGDAAMRDQDLVNDPEVGMFLAPPPPPPINDEFGNPIPGEQPVYDSRFDSEDDAIEFAEANGQGELTRGPDGELYNRFGEKMVYDSSGNLAPAPRDIPVGMVPDPNNPGGFVDDPNWVDPDQAMRDELFDEFGNPVAPPPGGFIDESGNPMPGEQPTYDSRFDSEEDAIKFAQENGQGELTQGADGELYNRFGEKMVYDPSGNLAPAPRDVPVGMVDDPNNPGGFVDDPNWVDPGFMPPPGYMPPDDPGFIPPPEYMPPDDPGFVPPGVVGSASQPMVPPEIM